MMARHSGALIKFISEENIKIFAEIGMQFGRNLSILIIWEEYGNKT